MSVTSLTSSSITTSVSSGRFIQSKHVEHQVSRSSLLVFSCVLWSLSWTALLNRSRSTCRITTDGLLGIHDHSGAIF